MASDDSHGRLKHELLVALLGYTGGLVIETEDSFRLAPENFLAEGEHQLLEQLLQVGFFHKRLTDFAGSVRRDHLAGDAARGHYAYALALRVEDVLDEFRERVSRLEDDMVETPNLQVAEMLAKFSEDIFVMGALHRIMLQVSKHELRGAALLDALWQTMSRAGCLTLQRSLARQLEGPGGVFVNQLVAWMVYGRLVDPFHEFLVQRCEGENDSEDLSKAMSPNEAHREWHRLFVVRRNAFYDAAPSLLTLDVARQVLFTGKAVRVLLRSGAAPLAVEKVQDELDMLRSCFSARPRYMLEHSILRLRDVVAKQLQELLRTAHLKEHLSILKGFYLLGYGAFYQTLLEGGSARPALVSLWEKALSEHMDSSSRGILEPEAAPRLQLVPRSLDLHCFDARKVQVMAGAHVENGLVLLPAHSQVWLLNKVRISGSFQHAFSFQLAPSKRDATALGSAVTAPRGARLALCFQPQWSPQDLRKRRHLERGAEEIPEPLEMWKSFGDCLTLELEYCVLRSLHQERKAEVRLHLYQSGPTELTSTTFEVPDADQMIHMVRLWYDSEKMRLQIFFGADAISPCCSAAVDIGDMAQLEMGCSFVGFLSLPLEQDTDREAVRIMTWRHQCRERLDFDEAGGRHFEDLTLTYQVPWPLPLIVTQSCLERYNRLFQQLLTYRHATLQLQHLLQPAGETTRLWAAFKAQLCFFWSQVLQFFLQDVAEASHQKLLEVVVNPSSTFDEVVRAHEEFLAKVGTHLFLEHLELRKELNAALRIAEVFAKSTAAKAVTEAELRRLQREFAETVKSFSRIMLSINQTGEVNMPLLVQLSSRLDFNHYFCGEDGPKTRQSWWQKYGSDG